MFRVKINMHIPDILFYSENQMLFVPVKKKTFYFLVTDFFKVSCYLLLMKDRSTSAYYKICAA